MSDSRRFGGVGSDGADYGGSGVPPGGSKIFSKRNAFLAIALLVAGSLFYAHLQKGYVASMSSEIEDVQEAVRSANSQLEAAKEENAKLLKQLQQAKDDLVESRKGDGDSAIAKRSLANCIQEKETLEQGQRDCKKELFSRSEEPAEASVADSGASSAALEEKAEVCRAGLKETTSRLSACLEKERTTLTEVESLRRQISSGTGLGEVKKVAEKASENAAELSQVEKELAAVKTADDPASALEKAESDVEQVEKNAEVLATDARQAMTVVGQEASKAEAKAQLIESAIAAPVGSELQEQKNREQAIQADASEQTEEEKVAEQQKIAERFKAKLDASNAAKRAGLSAQETAEKEDIAEEKVEVQQDLLQVKKAKTEFESEKALEEKDAAIVSEKKELLKGTGVGDESELKSSESNTETTLESGESNSLKNGPAAKEEMPKKWGQKLNEALKGTDKTQKKAKTWGFNKKATSKGASKPTEKAKTWELKKADSTLSEDEEEELAEEAEEVAAEEEAEEKAEEISEEAFQGKPVGASLKTTDDSETGEEAIEKEAAQQAGAKLPAPLRNEWKANKLRSQKKA